MTTTNNNRGAADLPVEARFKLLDVKRASIGRVHLGQRLSFYETYSYKCFLV